MTEAALILGLLGVLIGIFNATAHRRQSDRLSRTTSRSVHTRQVLAALLDYKRPENVPSDLWDPFRDQP